MGRLFLGRFFLGRFFLGRLFLGIKMLLIGSQAAKTHFSDFRELNNSDVDYILREAEVDGLLDSHFTTLSNFTYSRKGNRIKIISGGVKTDIEIDDSFELNDSVNGELKVASPFALIILKASHICFPLNTWEKTFADYHFLKNKLTLSPLWFDRYEALQKRIEKTKKRYGFKEHKFDVSNEKFFNDSVKRVLPHDKLHGIFAFNLNPMFLKVKKDINKAEISYDLFCSLDYQDQLKLMVEEIVVLTVERKLIPALQEEKEINLSNELKDMFKKMCTHYLPFDFRLFAVHNYNEIFKMMPESKGIIEKTKFALEN